MGMNRRRVVFRAELLGTFQERLAEFATGFHRRLQAIEDRLDAIEAGS